MTERYYNPDKSGITIVSEVLRQGVSEGWTFHDPNDFKVMQEKLASFNVVCTDHINGTWESATKQGE